MKKWLSCRFSGGITVDEPINRFMTEAESMVLFQVPADLLRAYVLPHELRDQVRVFIRERARLLSIRVVFSMFHDLPGPVIGIHMTLRIGIPFEFSTDC